MVGRAGLGGSLTCSRTGFPAHPAPPGGPDVVQRPHHPVHARDALVARTRGRAVTARALARPVPELADNATVADAIDVLRRQRAPLAVVCDDTGRLTGLVSLDDLLARYLQPRAI